MQGQYSTNMLEIQQIQQNCLIGNFNDCLNSFLIFYVLCHQQTMGMTRKSLVI